MNRPAASRETLNGVCCAAPILLSILALTLIAQGVIQFGTAMPTDEGLKSQIFQIVMLLQIPLIALFAFTADWSARGRTLRMLALQAGGWLTAVGAVAAWEWMAG
jgi:hypothetical protein